jgi:hypothetical protein
MANPKLSEVPLGFIPENTPQMEPFQSVPRPRTFSFIGALQFLSFLVCILAGDAVLDSFPWIKSNGLGPLAIVPFSLLGGLAVLWLRGYRCLDFMAGQRQKDEPLLQPIGEAERYVGIAYADADWSFRGDTSWDRGFIRCDGSNIEFRGFGPGFRLPLNRVRAVSCARTGLGSPNHLPRVYVAWEHPSGRMNSFSLEIRTARSRAEEIRRSVDLADWLCNCLPGRADDDATPIWPFESSKLELRSFPSSSLVTQSEQARIARTSVSFALMLILLPVFMAHGFSRHSDLVLFGAFSVPAAWISYHLGIRRLIEQHAGTRIPRGADHGLF